MNKTLSLAEELISIASVTPHDKGCQLRLVELLKPLGFICETTQSGVVSNLWARKELVSPLLVFAGHTDVVPPGSLDKWESPPFQPARRDGKLYGRGAADMKTSIAAMIIATEEFITTYPNHKGSIGFLITSDEEGEATEGTIAICKYLKARTEKLHYCIIGEPTSVHQLGDTVKNGRRGTMCGKLTINGIQGHIAYPDLAKNPIHQAIPMLAELITTKWDNGNIHYMPTSLQISNIHSGTGTSNIIPDKIVIDFNFRFSTASTVDTLQSHTKTILDKYNFDYNILWKIGGIPFLTPRGTLSNALFKAIKTETNIDATFSTSGGTSDGRFIAQICPQVIEFGPPNSSIHKVNEHIEICYINVLKNIYRRTLENLLL